MAVYVNMPQAEKRLDVLADKLPGSPSKTGLINEIVDRASRMSADELLRWLRPTATSPTAESAQS